MTRLSTLSRIALPLAGALALGACGSSEEPTYEADMTDESGGELIVRDAGETGVPVDVPDTEMTPVAPDTGAPVEATPTPE